MYIYVANEIEDASNITILMTGAGTTKRETLWFAEDLSLPKVQVIVMRANMSCSHCRQRVSTVISRMNGLMEYLVDMGNKEVVVRGLLHSNNTSSKPFYRRIDSKKKFSWSLGFHRFFCFAPFSLMKKDP